MRFIIMFMICLCITWGLSCTPNETVQPDGLSHVDGGNIDKVQINAGPGYCPGHAPIANPPTERCSQSTECKDNRAQCKTEPTVYRCGGARPRQECFVRGCSNGWICRTFACNEAKCVAPCTGSSCKSYESCEDGICKSKPCDQPGATPCPSTHNCSKNPQGVMACIPKSCKDGSHQCPVNTFCEPGTTRADANGCKAKPCKADSDCDCGSCINEACAPKPGYCFLDLAPP